MNGFTKLFSCLVTSSIWREDNSTRIVWVTMLAIADKKGKVFASLPGLAHVAKVNRLACERAITKLESPDKDSRSQEMDGRRIVRVDGGWQIVNYAKYRNLMRGAERAEYLRLKQQEHREKDNVNNVNNVNQCQPIAEAEAEAEADTNTIVPSKNSSKRYIPPTFEEFAKYIADNKLNIYNPENLYKGYAEADPPWHDTRGKPVRNWKLKLRTLHEFANRTRHSETQRRAIRPNTDFEFTGPGFTGEEISTEDV